MGFKRLDVKSGKLGYMYPEISFYKFRSHNMKDIQPMGVLCMLYKMDDHGCLQPEKQKAIIYFDLEEYISHIPFPQWNNNDFFYEQKEIDRIRSMIRKPPIGRYNPKAGSSKN